MNRKQGLHIYIGTMLLLVTVCTVAFGQRDEAEVAPERNPATPFRYVIVNSYSQIEQFVNRDPASLICNVLIEDKAFNEKNLRTLFRLLGTRFADKKGGLSVDVFTTLEAIPTPEEYDDAPLFGAIKDYAKFKYAFFNRNGNGEYFSYAIPGRQKEKRVIISKPKL